MLLRVVGAVVVGAVVEERHRRWLLVLPALELLRLVVSPGYRRQGIGTQLVEAGVGAVKAAGARAALLEVGYTNEPAIALYQRLDFEQLRARQDYYGPGRHALILKRYVL